MARPAGKSRKPTDGYQYYVLRTDGRVARAKFNRMESCVDYHLPGLEVLHIAATDPTNIAIGLLIGSMPEQGIHGKSYLEMPPYDYLLPEIHEQVTAKQLTVFADEEGRLNHRAPNPFTHGGCLVGNLVVCKESPSGKMLPFEFDVQDITSVGDGGNV